jgi:integrase
MSSGSSGAWSARYFDHDRQKYVSKTLGSLSDYPDSERYDRAQKEALSWFKHLGRGGSSDSLTVKDICDRYTRYLLTEKGSKAASDANQRFNRYVFSNTRLAKTEINKLRPIQVENWRIELKETKTTRGTNVGGLRSDSTLNRDISCLRSALNLAYKDGLVTSDFSWRGKLLPIKNADRKRDVYIDLEQRRTLIRSCPSDLAEFVKCSCLIPIRCGAIASLTVGNFDKKLKTLTIEKDKAGANRKLTLPPQTASFFEIHTKDKLPSARIFTRLDGKPWDKNSWGNQLKEVIKIANLPSNLTMYSIRHSVITDLIHNGLDSLTVAQLSGTSILMIEKHYGHLTKQHSREALSRLAI